MTELTEEEKDPQVAVVFPWRDQRDKDRRRSKAWLTEWYGEMHPEWDLILTDGEGAGPWNKPTAINYGVRLAKALGAQVVVVSDTDVFPLDDQLATAARHAMVAPWVVPHGRVLRLRQEPTAQLLKRRPGPEMRVPTSPLVRSSYRGMAGGGLFVIRVDNFLSIGGFDPRFTGWGAEDSAFGVCADTLLGAHLRYEHIPLVHMYHDPGLREANPHYGPNVELKRDYDAAAFLGRRHMFEFREMPYFSASKLLVERPSGADSYEEWLLYCYSLGLREEYKSVGTKMGLMSLAITAEHRR
jgi:hypothetical protein